MSKKFIPVVDNETPRSERDDQSKDMRKHRQFDTPFSMAHVRRDGAGAATGRAADRGSGGGNHRMRPSEPVGKFAKKRKHNYRNDQSNSYHHPRAPQHQYGVSLNELGVDRASLGDGEAANKVYEPTYEIPANRPTKAGEDGWDYYEGSPLLYSRERGLLFDERSSTYFKLDEATGEIEIYPPDAGQVILDSSVEDGKQKEIPKYLPDVIFGSDSWLGRKPQNEDRYIEDVDAGSMGRFFGLYDGHAGFLCADYLVANLHKNISYCFSREPADYTPPPPDAQGLSAVARLETSLFQQKEFQQNLKDLSKAEQMDGFVDDGSMEATKTQLKELIDLTASEIESLEQEVAIGNRSNKEFEEAVCKAIKDGCYLTDQAFLSLSRKKKQGLDSGSTAVGVFIHGEAPDDVRVIAPNVGDSRAILCRAGKALPLTDDHKPDRPDETKRIKRAGGSVIDCGGVFRIASGKAMAGASNEVFLSVARAFGDISLKEPSQCVTSEPEIEVRHLKPGDSAIILGCDGIWDVLSNQDAVDIHLEHKGRPKEAATAIVRAAFNKKSEDNLTVTVIEFPWAKNPLPEDEDDTEEVATLEPIQSAAVDDDLDMFG